MTGDPPSRHQCAGYGAAGWNGTLSAFGWTRTAGLDALTVDGQNATVFEQAESRLTFVYDGQGRRRTKSEYSWDNGQWVLRRETRYIWDLPAVPAPETQSQALQAGGWLCLQHRIDEDGETATETYLRGLDLSGSLEGAGGIGGMLAVTRSANVGGDLPPSSNSPETTMATTENVGGALRAAMRDRAGPGPAPSCLLYLSRNHRVSFGWDRGPRRPGRRSLETTEFRSVGSGHSRCPGSRYGVTSRAAILLFFDNGRGDITELADPVTGAVVAHYECSPFGKLLVSSGPLAEANPYRFSSKELDATGLAYYGYRYYSPELGRWINRDPIGERGGVNTLAMIFNGPADRVDFLGLEQAECNCCCCPDKLDWVYIKKLTGTLGHKFKIRFKLKMKATTSGGRKPCDYQWIETTNQPPPRFQSHGMEPDKPFDIFEEVPEYKEKWDDWVAGFPCTGEKTGKDKDDPQIGVKPGGGSDLRWLKIVIRIVSTCDDCADMELVFKQKLRVQGMSIGSDDWENSWSLPAPEGGNDGDVDATEFPY